MPKPTSFQSPVSSRMTSEEHWKRKEASALRCLDKNGKPINEQSKSVAVQDKRDSSDINRIVKRATRPDGQIDAAVLSGLAKAPGRFGDFTKAVDFQETQNRVIRMNNAFMALDPKVRLRFDNDPAKLIQFLYDPKNKAEAVKLGLLPPPVVETKKVETPEGFFWVDYEDGIETNRKPVPPAPAAPGASK